MKIFLLFFLILSGVTSECLGVEKCQCVKGIGDDGDSIDCREQNLKNVPKFKPSAILFNNLLLNKNNISILKDNSFSGLLLRNLDLSDNPLFFIYSRAFSGINLILESLKLDLSKSQQLPNTAFSSLIGLKKLYIFGYNQEKLEYDNFFSFGILEELHITKSVNGFKIISPSVFGSLRLLHLLDLSYNFFESIPINAIKRLNSLRNLIMMRNHFKGLNNKSFTSSPSIEFINLSFNQLGNNISPDAFVPLQNSVNHLILSSCSLSINLKFLSTLYKIKILDLSRNLIINIPPNLFLKAKNLVEINLSFNKLTSLPEKLFSFPSLPLNVFHLNSNPLILTKTHLSQLKKLQYLNLNSIKALKMSQDFFSMQSYSLSHLDLSQVKLGNEIFPILFFLPNVQLLNLSQTSLSSIPEESFQKNSRLKILDLSKNQIKKIKKNSFNGLQKSLTFLSLDSNFITHIDKCFLNNFNYLDFKGFSLMSNPLQCSCDLIWLKNLIHESNLCIQYDFTSCDQNQKNNCNKNIETNENKENLNLEINNINYSNVDLKWSVNEKLTISSFLISYRLLKFEDDQIVLFEVDSTQRSFIISQLQHSSKYEICIEIKTNNDLKNREKKCRVIKTKGWSNKEKIVGTIIGGVVGALAFLIAMVLIFICIRFAIKKKNSTKKNIEQIEERPEKYSYASHSLNNYNVKNSQLTLSDSNLNPFNSSSNTVRLQQRQFENKFSKYEEKEIFAFMMDNKLSRKTMDTKVENSNKQTKKIKEENLKNLKHSPVESSV